MKLTQILKFLKAGLALLGLLAAVDKAAGWVLYRTDPRFRQIVDGKVQAGINEKGKSAETVVAVLKTNGQPKTIAPHTEPGFFTRLFNRLKPKGDTS